MKKIWKKGTAVALAAMMGLSLTACGGAADSPAESSGAGAAGSSKADGKLTVAIWDNAQKPGLDEIMADFTRETGIAVDLQVITWDSYWTLLEAGASGGDMPDVFWMHSNQAVKYMSNDILMDLTDRISKSEKLEMDKFPEDIKAMYQYDGKTYAVPKDIDTIALWYNKTMFDEAGIPYPDESWTWDTLYENAVKLTNADQGQYGIAMNPSNEQDGWMNIIYSMGGNIISEDQKKSGLDDPNTIKAMEYVSKLIKDAMPPANVMAETGTDVLLSSGKIAMLSQGSWMVAAFKDNDYISQNCDVAMLPKDAETGKRVSLYNGLGWAAYAGTRNPEGAWQLIEFLGTKDMQLKQAQLGVTMAAYEGVSEDWIKNTDKFNLQPYLEMMQGDIVFRPHSTETLVWWNMMVEELKAVWSGNADAVSVCQSIAAQMNDMLAQEQ